MKRLVCGAILALTAAAATAGPRVEPGVPGKGFEPNLATQVFAPGGIRAEFEVYGRDLEKPLRYTLAGVDGLIKGGVYVPPGEGLGINVVVYDQFGEVVYSGKDQVSVDAKLTPEISIPLSGGDSKYPPQVKLGSYLAELALRKDPKEQEVLALTVVDPRGNPIGIQPVDIDWRLPDGFVVLPYSCFMNALCILRHEIKEVDFVPCWRDITCVPPNPPTPPTGYKRVAVGDNHACAITTTDEIRCWGSNSQGQLGAPTGFCQFAGRNCSLVPVAVVCQPGESCKFRSVAAGADHTCAIDTNGKAWCWGEDGIFATGDPTPNAGAMLPEHRLVPAFTGTGGKVDFTEIDTNFSHTCARSAAQDVFCWGSNTRSQLGYPQAHNNGTPRATMVMSGNKYASVRTGFKHTCAIHAHTPGFSGLMDCWGDNFDFQLTGNPNNAISITVNPKVPLLNNQGVKFVATGPQSTCAQTAQDDTVCWGSAKHGGAVTTHTAGYTALRQSYARTMASDADQCGVAGACTRICITDLGGDLLCGRYMELSTPAPLDEVPDPKSVAVISWNQVDVGPNNVCAVSSNDDVWCLGSNEFGQFGTGQRSTVRTDEFGTMPTMR